MSREPFPEATNLVSQLDRHVVVEVVGLFGLAAQRWRADRP